MHAVEVVDSPERKVVALVLETSFSDRRQVAEIPPFFHRVMEEGRLKTVPYRVNGNQLCAFVVAPGTPDFTYYMGVEVEDFDFVPAGMRTLTIPACRCARTSFVKRGNADVLHALDCVRQTWLPANGYAQDQNVPLFVYYDAEFLRTYETQGYAGNPVAQLWVPVMQSVWPPTA